ncbi:MAG TPA: hypothetical protein DEB25_08160 [Desulfobulbaceae bacterium]|nr:hypothetical protein [Desulfobulbaceae bacterium]
MQKAAILNIIYDRYDEWARQFAVVCRPSCRTCCTRNVTMTTVEGEEILRYALRQGLEKWLGEALNSTVETAPPPVTTNQFAAACLAGQEIEPEWPANQAPCPVLADDLCRIYTVRPFACRLFVSSQRCRLDGAAVMPAAYTGVVSAICQLIEHLGQRQYWGNMADILLALVTRPGYEKIAYFVAPEKITAARNRLLVAEPLPGFLLDEREAALAAPLFNAIFHSEAGGKTVETILNGG